MKTYAVRQELRTPVHCQFYCFYDGTLTTGMVWDLSATGWRATADRPIPSGFETTVSMTLREGKECHHILIDSAIVRWTDGCDVGWEIMGIDELTQTRLADFLEQCERKDWPSGVLKETHCNVR